MKTILIDKWCYSSNGEYFSSEEYDTKEEAIKDCLDDYENGYVGRIARVMFTENDITYDETGYYLGIVLEEEVGEAGENWEMTADQEIELSNILAKDVIKYINEHNLQPTCYKVVEIEEVE